MHEASATRSPLLTKTEAADLCRCSLRHFERHVQPHVAPVTIGSRVLFHQEDLLRWLDNQRAGGSLGTLAAVATSFGSRTAVAATASPQAKEILGRLRRRRRGSTPRSSPVGGSQGES